MGNILCGPCTKAVDDDPFNESTNKFKTKLEECKKNALATSRGKKMDVNSMALELAMKDLRNTFKYNTTQPKEVAKGYHSDNSDSFIVRHSQMSSYASQSDDDNTDDQALQHKVMREEMEQGKAYDTARDKNQMKAKKRKPKVKIDDSDLSRDDNEDNSPIALS